MGYLTMNDKEREQAKIFARIKEGVMTQREAAARLDITDRWIRKKIKRFDQFDDLGLIHRSRGKASPRRWNQAHEQLLIDLLKGEWHDFGPTFATQKLDEIYSITVSREVVRKAMIRAELWKPKKHRMKHRKRRDRRPMFGMMIQLDGSPHDWFEGRAEQCTLVVFIDDATSKVVWLEFVQSESNEAVMGATKRYVETYGRPHSFYTDHGSVFHVNLNNQDEHKKTQFERACKALNIDVIHAHSPQAKGRVERCNQTMQDRLIKEMRLARVSSIDEANNYLRTSDFIAKHNATFAVEAASQGDAHRDHASYDLDDIFSIKETRKLNNDYTITHRKHIFQLHDQQRTIVRPKNEITVSVRLDGTIRLWIRKTELVFSEIKARQPKEKQLTLTTFNPKKPHINSRRWVGGLYPISHQESRVNAGPPAAEAVDNNRNFSLCTKPELFTLR